MERAIGRMKDFAIVKATLPLSMARIADQIVTVCAVLIPPFSCDLSDVDDYFVTLSESDSDYDADSESSNNES